MSQFQIFKFIIGVALVTIGFLILVIASGIDMAEVILILKKFLPTLFGIAMIVVGSALLLKARD